MSKISDDDLKEYIKNTNHSSDIMKECLIKGFARVDVQHSSQLEELKDQKKETILLRTVTNDLIKSMGKNNKDIMIAMIGVIGTAMGVCLAIIKLA